MADFCYPAHRRRYTPGESLDFCELCGCAVERRRLILSEVEGLRGHWICDVHANESELRVRPSFDDMGGVNNTIGYPGEKPEPAGGSNNIWWEDFEVSKPTVTVEAVVPQASETGRTGLFRFRRQHPTLDSVLAVYYSIGGTANAGVDYYALSGVATFIAGADFVDVQVVAIDDSDVETSETIIVSIAPNAAYDVGDPSSATVTLVNNEEVSSWYLPIQQPPFVIIEGEPWKELPPGPPALDPNKTVVIRSGTDFPAAGNLVLDAATGTTAILDTDYSLQVDGEDVVSLPYAIPVSALEHELTLQLNVINGDSFPHSYRLVLEISDGLNTKAIETTTHRYVFTS